MARIRTVKPEFFTSEDIVELPPLARLLYIAMWCEADKEGRLAWKPKTFKMRYLPADNCDVDAICDAIVTRGLVVLYGDGLAVIPSFKDHQHINPREKDSCLPAPTAQDLTRRARVTVAPVTGREEGRKEGKGREGNNSTSEQSPDTPGLPGVVAERRQSVLAAIEDALPTEVAAAQEVQAATGKARKHHGTEEDHKAAQWIFDRIRKVDATAKQPNWDGWANDIRLMREIDGRTHTEICELFDWANKDKFWCSNILSPAKLREKWGQLTVQRGRSNATVPNRNGRPDMMRVAHLDHSSTVAAAEASRARMGAQVPLLDIDSHQDF